MQHFSVSPDACIESAFVFFLYILLVLVMACPIKKP